MMALGLGLAASSAHAATVDFTLDAASDGTFDLFADVSQGDNAGLSFVGVELLGIDTIQNLAPMVAYDEVEFEPHGFHYFRSPDDDPTLVAVQAVTNPDSLVYGFGQTAGSLPSGYGEVQPNYGAPLLLATGTYTDPGALDMGDVMANVLVETGSNDVIGADVSWLITLDGAAMASGGGSSGGAGSTSAMEQQEFFVTDASKDDHVSAWRRNSDFIRAIYAGDTATRRARWMPNYDSVYEHYFGTPYPVGGLLYEPPNEGESATQAAISLALTVPEPATCVIFAFASVALLRRRRAAGRHDRQHLRRHVRRGPGRPG